VLLGPASPTATFVLIQVRLTATNFPSSVVPGTTYYWSIFANSSYSDATLTKGTFIVTQLNVTCNLLSSLDLEQNVTLGYGEPGTTPITSFVQMTGTTSGGSCAYMLPQATRDIAAHGTATYYFRLRWSATAPATSWGFQAVRLT
jgi:hypothetical protein